MERIRPASITDLPKIRELWEVCFPAEGGFNDYFFSHIFNLSDVLLLEDDQILCSMVQEIPITLGCGGQAFPATYIYGACTAPAARGKGCMERLLHQSFQRDLERGRVASCLIPAQPSLFDFYRRFGYETVFYQSTWLENRDLSFFSPAYTIEVAQSAHLSQMEEIYTKKVSGLHPFRTSSDWLGQVQQFSALGGQAFVLQKQGICLGYAFVWAEADALWAQEMVCGHEPDQQVFAQLLMQRYGAEHIKVTGLPGVEKTPIAMLKAHTNFPVQKGYLNLLWN